jgi:hypothetical protein
MTRLSLALGLVLVLGATGCAPTIHVVDRHTILEDEAAGEWPDFDKQLRSASTEPLPVPFPKTAVNAKRKRLYNVLDAEFVPEKAAKK